MIKLQLNKYKIISLLKVVESVIHYINQERSKLVYSTKRMELAAHIDVLQELSTKLKIKFITVEHKPDMQRFIFSVNKIQAYVLMLYKDNCLEASSYDIGTMQEISIPVFKQLLN